MASAPQTESYGLLYLVKRLESAARVELSRLTRPLDLTAKQYTALTVLELHPDLTASHLARHAFVTAQSGAEMVSTLLARGLIERHRDPADRRRLVIALTREGQEVLDRLHPQVAALEARMLQGLEASEAAGLRHALEACSVGLARVAQDGDAGVDAGAEAAAEK